MVRKSYAKQIIYTIAFIILVNCNVVVNTNVDNEKLYFAYGSNLLESRIHHNNPNVRRYNIGKLKDYQLDFVGYSNRWKGAVASIIPKNGSEVWGAIYEVTQEDITSLDRQESVHLNIYKPFEVDVILENGMVKKCRVYQHCSSQTPIENFAELSKERQPSWSYLETIQKGAKESNLPEKYQQFLSTIKHNNITDPPQLNLED